MNWRIDARSTTPRLGEWTPRSDYEAEKVGALRRTLIRAGVSEIEVPQPYTDEEPIVRMRVGFGSANRFHAMILIAEDLGRFLTTVDPSRLVSFEEQPRDPIRPAVMTDEAPAGAMSTIFDMRSRKGLGYVQANETWITVTLKNPNDPEQLSGAIGNIINRRLLNEYAERFGTQHSSPVHRPGIKVIPLA
jgi:hypothetical protein